MSSSSRPDAGLSPADQERIAREVFGDRFDVAARYVQFLGTAGLERGLMGPREADRLWDRHVLNSVALAGLLGEGESVVDVGSGAGLPGVPLAILRPDLEVTLLEPLLRRATFLAEVVELIGLPNVEVERGRAEDAKGSWDVVTCRAVARLDKLLGWTKHLFWPTGRLVALKGESAAAELGAARGLLKGEGLSGEVVVVRAQPEVEPTYALKVFKRV